MSKSPFDKMSERFTRNLAGFSVAPRFSLEARRRPAGGAARFRCCRWRAPRLRSRQNRFRTQRSGKGRQQMQLLALLRLDGVLCSCCGGGITPARPGAEPSPISWIGTCVNPEDGESFVIAYRDCCGKPSARRANIAMRQRRPGAADVSLPAQQRHHLVLRQCLGDLSLLDRRVGGLEELIVMARRGRLCVSQRDSWCWQRALSLISAPDRPSRSNIERGTGQLSLNCGGCHGFRGVSNPRLVPSLKDLVGYYLRHPKAALICRGCRMLHFPH